MGSEWLLQLRHEATRKRRQMAIFPHLGVGASALSGLPELPTTLLEHSLGGLLVAAVLDPANADAVCMVMARPSGARTFLPRDRPVVDGHDEMDLTHAHCHFPALRRRWRIDVSDMVCERQGALLGACSTVAEP